MLKYILLLLTSVLISCSTSKLQTKNYLFKSRDIGDLVIKLEINKSVKDLKYHSPRNRLSKIVGFHKAFLIKLFSKKGFNKGSLLSIKINDTNSSKGIAYTPIGNYFFKSTSSNTGEVQGIFLDNNNKIVGNITPLNQNSDINIDYKNIIDSMFNKIYSYMYNAKKKEKTLNRLYNKLISKSRIIEDEMEFLLLFYIHSRSIKSSHFGLLKNFENKDINTNNNSINVKKKINDSTYYVKIDHFDCDIKEITSMFDSIIPLNYPYLIFDLRNNEGGNIEPAYKFASYFISEPTSGGYFLTNKWHSNYSRFPTNEEVLNFKKIDTPSFNTLIQLLNTNNGVEIILKPNKNLITSKIFFLTNNHTASTCEPIIYGLKNNKNVTIVGEKTAGAMLSAHSFNLPSNYIIFLPTADYYTSDGIKLENNGILPNFNCSSDSALIKATSLILSK